MNKHIKKSSVLWLVLLGLSFHYTLPAQTAQPDPTLKLHFDFEQAFSGGRVIDTSGNGNDGWQMNPTNWITATNGVFASTAAQFRYNNTMCDGTSNGQTNATIYPGSPGSTGVHFYTTSQYIALTNLNGFAFLTNGTISLWAKFDPNTDTAMTLLSSGFTDVYAWSPTLCSNSWNLGRVYNPYLVFALFPAGDSLRQVVRWPDDTSADLSTSNFHLYSLTVDCPSNQAIAYYDGQPYMTNTLDVPWIRIYGTASKQWLCIGALAMDGTPMWGDDMYPNSAYFNGRMDDIRIYNRTLSAAEIQALYQGSTYAQNLRIEPSAPQSVQLTWPTKSNATYQVEYVPSLLAGLWSPLGLPIPGNGQTDSVSDSTAGQASRFYRVRLLP